MPRRYFPAAVFDSASSLTPASVVAHRKRGRFSALKPGPLPESSGRGWLAQVDRTWINGWYCVLARPVETAWGRVEHLAVRDFPGDPLTWAELQWVKDNTLGPARVAVEVYPAAADVVDEANMYHLWVLPEGFRLPFTL